MKLKFGGRAETLCKSLDEKFLKEDVANLAMLSYEDSIKDGSFFFDKNLLAFYFKNTVNPRTVFQSLFLI